MIPKNESRNDSQSENVPFWCAVQVIGLGCLRYSINLSVREIDYYKRLDTSFRPEAQELQKFADVWQG